MRLNDSILRQLEDTWLQATLGIRDGSHSSRPVSESERAAAVNACLGTLPLLIDNLQTTRRDEMNWMREADQRAERISEITKELEGARQRLQVLEQPASPD